ncbi:hypothetical protein PC116_g19612 [Phytophthora cactorum]|uniref:Uncharacterized protein n=2 Tax=Phytophthora cactorum TaxID=29920 RepID=A0A8T1BI81_9STRA|nr:hypothetical protein Pcac1_g18480 [Phytophthora cactorum]KAG2898751.1 hypothetical protein PC114_g14173 [Phytophthora cactorum]KAG2904363.1 hypothetical protein PC115_g15018 [Phytophthora cactorum]KAG2962822.1 hypothetical protein PC118_g21225 [Phytophthora cactorum]KAG2973592.1 hypothetical protein PC119_g22872 [Phytophthora cactorum]
MALSSPSRLLQDAVLAFFGHICSPAHTCDLDSVHVNDATNAPLSVSYIWGYRSALVDVYCAKLIELDTQLDTELRRVLDGYEKTVNSLKKSGLMKINEVKRGLKSSIFGLLALKLMTEAPSRKGQNWGTTLFGWSYFVLMWNLMSRSESIDSIMLQHMEWTEDCLSIEEQGHKGDQKGVEKFGKHVYANPFTPSQCPILALAVHLIPVQSTR